MPCESRRMTPICDGVRPFLASLVTCSRTSVGEVLSQDGGVRRYGSADLEIPFLRGATGGRQRKPQPAALMATGSSISGAVRGTAIWRGREAHPLLCIRPMAAGVVWLSPLLLPSAQAKRPAMTWGKRAASVSLVMRQGCTMHGGNRSRRARQLHSAPTRRQKEALARVSSGGEATAATEEALPGDSSTRSRK